jgi:hypothetical protein
VPESNKNEERHHEISAALNLELTVLGIPRMLLFVSCVLGICVGVLAWSLLWMGITIICLCLISIWATTSDPVFPQILWTALKQWIYGPVWDPFQYQDWKLNLCGFLDDGECFLTWTNDVGIIVECAGVDTDCLSAEQRDRIAERIEKARHELDDRMIYTEIYSRRRVELRGSATTKYEAAGLSAQARQGHVNAEGLYAESLHYVFLGLDPRSQLRLWPAIRNQQLGLYFSRWRYQKNLEAEIEARQEHVRQKVSDFMMELKDVLGLRVLKQDEAFPVMWRLLNFGGNEPAKLGDDEDLSGRLADSFISCDQRHLELDDNHVIVQAMKSPPSDVRPLVFEEVREVRGNVNVVMTWQQLSPERQRELAKRKKHWWRGRYRGLPGHANVQVERLAKGENLQAVEDLEALERQLLKRDRQGYFSLTAVVYDAEPAKARAAAAELRSIFTRAGATVIVDRFNQLTGLLSTVPGNYERLFRRMVLMNSQAADIAQWALAERGEMINAHLQGDCLGVLRTKQRTPFYFNLHGRPGDGTPDVAHTIIEGKTGSGKSVLGGQLLLMLTQYDPFILAVDRGGSYHGVMEAIDGARVTVAPGERCGLQPFPAELTAFEWDFLTLFVRSLIEPSVGRLTAPQVDELHAEIGRMYAPGMDASLRTLWHLHMGLTKALSKPLERWVRCGADAEWFDNEQDAVGNNRISYFDLPLKLNPEVARAYLLCILHRWQAVFRDPANVGVLKVSLIDEAQNLFREQPDLAAYAVQAAEQFRKDDGVLILLTQSVASFLNPELRGLIDNVETLISFAAPKMSDALGKELQLTPEELGAIRSLGGRDEILFKQGKLSKRLQTAIDPWTLWLLQTDAVLKRKRAEAFKQFGVLKGVEVLQGNGHDRTVRARSS